MTRLEVLLSGPTDPVENMALDEALFALAAERPPTLRLYEWRPAALSLGYFQSANAFTDHAASHIVVRRATGGGAICHERELTFALVAPKRALPHEIDAGYELVHGAITAALADCGVPVTRYGRGSPSARPQQKWCFEHPTRHDLMTPHGKIVGSAQRRTDSRVLHHGSIVLCAPSLTPKTGSVEEFVDPEVAAASLPDAIVSHLSTALDRDAEILEARPIGVAHLEEARRLVVERTRHAR